LHKEFVDVKRGKDFGKLVGSFVPTAMKIVQSIFAIRSSMNNEYDVE